VRAAVDEALELDPAPGRLVRRGTPGPGDLWPTGGPADCDPCADAGPWSFVFGLGLSLAQGNSDKLDVHLDGEAVYEVDPLLLRAKAAFAYGESEGDVSTEAWHATARIERKLGRSLYAFGQLDFDRDVPAELEYRFVAVAGLGAALVDTPALLLKGELGGGWTWEERTGLAPTAAPSAYVGAHLKRTWEDCRTLTVDWRFVPNLDDFDLTVATWDAKFVTPLCDGLDLTVGLRVDWVIDPPGDAEPVDLLLAVGLRLAL
jgi:hypothetical protein